MYSKLQSRAGPGEWTQPRVARIAPAARARRLSLPMPGRARSSVPCPICGRSFALEDIAEHADTCATRLERASKPPGKRQREPNGRQQKREQQCCTRVHQQRCTRVHQQRCTRSGRGCWRPMAPTCTCASASASACAHALRLLASQARPGVHSLRVCLRPLGGAAARSKCPARGSPCGHPPLKHRAAILARKESPRRGGALTPA